MHAEPDRPGPRPRPMTVVDVINLSTSADTLLRERVLALRASGIDNHIVCMDGPRVPALRALGIPVHVVDLPRGLNPWKLATALTEMTAHLRRIRPDIVHTHCAVPGLVGRLAAWLAGVPVIIHTAHGFHFHDRMPWLKRLPYVMGERLSGLVTDTLLTQTRADLDQANRFGIGPRARRHRIGNGIDLARFRPIRRVRADGVPTMTCVARLEPVKNHRMLLEAAHILKRRGTSFRLRLVGDGPLRSEYEALCRRLGIEAEVEFLGYRNDVVELLAESDLAVLTSYKEGLPRAVLEPMAMGLPVVATRAPGTCEAVRQGDNGLAVEIGDTDGLADAIQRLIEDPELRARLGERGRRMALEEFDESRIVDALRELYDSRLRDRSAGAAAAARLDGVEERGSSMLRSVPGVERGMNRPGQSVGRSALSLMAGQVVYSLINVAAMALLGNALAPHGYGEYAFYYALIPLIASASDAGVGIIVTREVARDPARGPRLLGDALWIKGIVSGTILLGVLVASWTLMAPPAAALVSLVAATALIDPSQDPSIWIFRARGLLHFEALLLVLSQVIWLPLLVLGIATKAGLAPLLAAATVGFLVRLAVGAVILVRRFGLPEFQPERARLRRLLAEGLPFGVAMFSTVLYGRVGVLVLKAFATSSDVAYFNVSYMFSQPLNFVANVLAIAIMPMVARDARAGDQALRRDLLLNFKWQAISALPLAAGLWVLARPVLTLLFRGHGFGPAADGLRLLSLGLPVMFLNLSSRYMLTALDRQRYYLRAILVGLAVNVTGCLVLIPRLGFLGACGAYLAAEVGVAMVCYHAMDGRVHVTELARTAAKPLLAALGMAALVYASRHANLITLAVLGAVSYVAFLLALRVFSGEELRMLRAVGGSIGLPRTTVLQRAEDRS